MTEMPDKITAWRFDPSKSDEWVHGGWSEDHDHKSTEYVRADLAGGKVKTLEWEGYGKELFAYAFGVGPVYRVSGTPGEWSLFSAGRKSYAETPGYETQEAAKAAAQVDYERRILSALEPAPQQSTADGDVTRLLGDIRRELTRARAKFPGKNVTFAALVEEVGELSTATFEESSDRVREEAVQVAVMAMRMVLDGDHMFDEWRTNHDLDPLDPSTRAALAAMGGTE